MRYVRLNCYQGKCRAKQIIPHIALSSASPGWARGTTSALSIARVRWRWAGGCGSFGPGRGQRAREGRPALRSAAPRCTAAPEPRSPSEVHGGEHRGQKQRGKVAAAKPSVE